MPLPFPQPPTDNLYKFMALSGLALWGAGFYGALSTVNEIREHDFDHIKELAILAAQTSSFEQEIESFQLEVKAHRKHTADLTSEVESAFAAARAPDGGLPEERLDRIRGRYRDDILALKEESDAILGTSKQQDVVLREHKVKWAALQADMDRLQEQRLGFKNEKWWFYALMALGGAVASIGFALWYFKVQRHLDAQLAKEAAAIDVAADTADKASPTIRPAEERPEPPENNGDAETTTPESPPVAESGARAAAEREGESPSPPAPKA